MLGIIRAFAYQEFVIHNLIRIFTFSLQTRIILPLSTAFDVIPVCSALFKHKLSLIFIAL